jgi:hypothetical protein
LILFGTPPTQISIEGETWDNVHPNNTLSFIEFSIACNGEQCFDLTNMLLHLKVHILKGNGAVLANDDNVGPVNSFILGDTVLTCNNTYPY